MDDNDGQNTLKRSNRQLVRPAKAKTEPDRTKIVKITERIDILSVLGQSTRVGQGSGDQRCAGEFQDSPCEARSGARPAEPGG